MYFSNMQNIFLSRLSPPTVLPSFPFPTNFLFRQNVFVSIAKCICLNCKMYLSQLQNIFLSRFSPPAVLPCFPFPTNYIYNFILRQNPFVSIKKYICLNCKMYLSQLQNKFVSIAKRICLNCICLNC